MATPAQIAANQANAQLSTGPSTPEGKARVSRNALRHGLTAKHLVVREDEQAEFDALESALAAEIHPQGALETLTFHELLHAAWNLARFRRIEAEVSCGSPMDLYDPDTSRVLDRLARYQTRAQRAYYKAMDQLRILQTNRALRASILEQQNAKEAPALADIRKLTKQTRSGIAARPHISPTHGIEPAGVLEDPALPMQVLPLLPIS